MLTGGRRRRGAGLTLRSLDLKPVLEAGVRAARAWASLLCESGELRLLTEPELDIVGYYPRRPSLSEIDAASARVLDAGMQAEDRVYLSTLRVEAEAFPPMFSATPTAPASCAAC